MFSIASFATSALALALLATASAKQIVITVGGNTTDNATTVFAPAEVKATIGDVVFFNFTQGNHTATQSTFGNPCTPAHISDETINGFDSAFRDTLNGTVITNLQVQITSNDTLWFYDANLCGEGGVGGINVNESSTATLEGFRRNAIRLNGTATATSSGSSATHTSPGASGTQSSGSTGSTGTSDRSSGAEHSAVVLGFGTVLPMVVAVLLL